MFYNAYLYTGTGYRVILVENVSHETAERACHKQLIYLPKVERYGDCWLGDGLESRLVIVETSTEAVGHYDKYIKPPSLQDIINQIMPKYETW
jgi:hypothetical protein